MGDNSPIRGKSVIDLIIGIGEDEDGNIILVTDHDDVEREIVLGKLSLALVATLFQTAEFLEAAIEADKATIH